VIGVASGECRVMSCERGADALVRGSAECRHTLWNVILRRPATKDLCTRLHNSDPSEVQRSFVGLRMTAVGRSRPFSPSALRSTQAKPRSLGFARDDNSKVVATRHSPLATRHSPLSVYADVQLRRTPGSRSRGPLRTPRSRIESWCDRCESDRANCRSPGAGCVRWRTAECLQY
jgi:hypothetical protein